MTDVIVVGGGPAGMMLAGELALAGVDVVVVERRPDASLAGSRAGGFHSRTIEILDQRGIADRFLAVGQTAQTARFGATALDIAGLPTRHPYGLALWQNEIEPILREWIEDLGVRIEYGREVVGLAQDADGVRLTFADGRTDRAAYVAGADGGRSVVRKLTGIAFSGTPASRSSLIAEVAVREEPPSGVRHDRSGVHGFTLMADGLHYRVVTTERELGGTGEATLDDLRAALVAVFGTDFGVHDPLWLSRFTDATRQAETYRSGRVLLVGDAAHVHYPAGGQGIGLGIQDAVNLGFKLALVVCGRAPAALLDTYAAERHPADARVLQLSMALTALQSADPRTSALAALLDGTVMTDDARERTAALIHGLDVAYDLGGAHPLVGRRMPDLDIRIEGGVSRVAEILRTGRPVLLELDGAARSDAAAWGDRVEIVAATTDGPWMLPVLGEVPAPAAVLIRPDGHVAWVDDGTEPLAAALTRWLGHA